MNREPEERGNKTLFEADAILGKGKITIQEWPMVGEVILYMDGDLIGSVDASEFFKAFEARP